VLVLRYVCTLVCLARREQRCNLCSLGHSFISLNFPWQLLVIFVANSRACSEIVRTLDLDLNLPFFSLFKPQPLCDTVRHDVVYLHFRGLVSLLFALVPDHRPKLTSIHSFGAARRCQPLRTRASSFFLYTSSVLKRILRPHIVFWPTVSAAVHPPPHSCDFVFGGAARPSDLNTHYAFRHAAEEEFTSTTLFSTLVTTSLISSESAEGCCHCRHVYRGLPLPHVEDIRGSRRDTSRDSTGGHYHSARPWHLHGSVY
jgi:hypothetical protein